MIIIIIIIIIVMVVVIIINNCITLKRTIRTSDFGLMTGPFKLHVNQ